MGPFVLRPSHIEKFNQSFVHAIVELGFQTVLRE